MVKLTNNLNFDILLTFISTIYFYFYLNNWYNLNHLSNHEQLRFS